MKNENYDYKFDEKLQILDCDFVELEKQLSIQNCYDEILGCLSLGIRQISNKYEIKESSILEYFFEWKKIKK